TLLVPPAELSSPLVALEPARGLRVIGLGRPPSEAALAARLERAAELPRERGPVAALLATGAFPLAAPARARIAAAGGRPGVYLALGGGGAPLTLGAAHDPGPLTRTGPEDEAEPGYALVKLGGAEPVLRAIDSGDRARLAIELDLDVAGTSGGVASLDE